MSTFIKPLEITGLEIEKFRERHGFTKTELADLLGLERQTYYNYVKPGSKIPMKTAKRIMDMMARYVNDPDISFLKEYISSRQINAEETAIRIGISTNEIKLKIKGFMVSEESSKAIREFRESHQKNSRATHLVSEPESNYGRHIRLPFLSIPVQGGFADNLDGIPVEEYIEESFYVFPQPGEHYDKAIVIEVSGESMEPTFYKNDKLLAREIAQSDWEYINPGLYAVVYDKTFTIKRVVKNTFQSVGYIELHADNLRYRSLVVHMEEIRKMWRIDALLQRRY